MSLNVFSNPMFLRLAYMYFFYCYLMRTVSDNWKWPNISTWLLSKRTEAVTKMHLVQLVCKCSLPPEATAPINDLTKTSALSISLSCPMLDLLVFCFCVWKNLPWCSSIFRNMCGHIWQPHLLRFPFGNWFEAGDMKLAVFLYSLSLVHKVPLWQYFPLSAAFLIFLILWLVEIKRNILIIE